ncbi:DNA-binding transcriptional LysR family regulator [Methylobacterium brachythecii]|uniref:DNA-binding transcriptional LysR family regulator n=1 Tax=Methylobacterium brachythecii TaxID=1176177 RepID=A0A7W6AMS2_9HYPH|nr:DNA-binding transcriptional LysR family regulator [Methylobacterium brachythecii]
MSPPAVTQRLRALEERLRVHLVDRSGRQLTLTDEGELLAERGRLVLEDLEDLDDAIATRRGQVRGHLRVIASLGFGRRHVAPVASQFQEDHPELKIDLILSDRLGGIPTSGWDLAVHVGELDHTASSLVMRHLAPNERWACAAPDYLHRNGTPGEPDALHAHACIALRENDEDVTLWRFGSIHGLSVGSVRIEPRLSSNDGDVVRGWALAGRGIIVRSEWDVAEDVREGRLVRVLQEFALPAAPVVALLGSRRQARAARTGRFLDALQAALDPTPWRLPRGTTGMDR